MFRMLLRLVPALPVLGHFAFANVTAHADNLPAAAAGDLVLAPIAFTSDATRLSYIRVANPGTTAGTVTAVIEDQNGQVLGTWTKAAPANTSKQYGLDVIQREAGIPAPAGFGRIEINSDFSGSIQHVAYNAKGGALTNISNCGAQSISDVGTLTNVHTSLIAAFPSRISISAAAAGRAVLTIFDSETGVQVGTWTSPALAAGQTYIVDETRVQQDIGFQPTAAQFHLTFKLQAGFNGTLAHLVDNLTAGVLTDMTARCKLRAWTKLNATTPAIVSGGSILINASGILKRNDGSRIFVWSGSTGNSRGQLTCLPSHTVAARITADGTVTSATDLLHETGPGPVNAFKYVVGDFNGDGQDDVFSGNSGCDEPPFFPGERESLFLSTPTGYVDASANLPQFNHYNHGADGADLRKNGKIDIIVNLRAMLLDPTWAAAHPGGNTTPDGRVGTYMLRGNGDGTFVYDTTSLPDNIAAPYNFAVNDPRRHIVTSARVGDLNADGYPDLIAGVDQEDTAPGGSLGYVYFNDGTGKFRTTERKLPVGYFGAANNITLDMVVRDLNGDGRNDIITLSTEWVPYYDKGRLQAIISNADGTFTDATATYFPGQGVNNVAGFRLYQPDLNGDGCDDLLIQADRPATGDVMAYKCGTDGTFRAYNVGAVRALSWLRFDGRQVISTASYTDDSSDNPNRPVSVDVYEYK